MPRVLVTPNVLSGVVGPYRDVLQAADLEVVYPPEGVNLMDPTTLVKHLEGIDAVLAGMEPFNAEVLPKTRLRVIARMGVGYDAIDVPAATRQKIAVTITPGTNEPAVAEHTLALLLAVMRDIVRRHHMVVTGNWRRMAGPRLAGKTLGLVGMGRIGRALVPRAKGLGLRVIACDPMADVQFAAQHEVRLCTLDELLAAADVVSLHAPATPETFNLIDADALAKMKPGAVLINTARGWLVDEEALAGALRSGHLYGAGLDVFHQEPLPKTSPLIGLDNIVLCPHMAGLDTESEIAMSRLAAQCIADLYQGRWPEGCVVNDELRSGWHW